MIQPLLPISIGFICWKDVQEKAFTILPVKEALNEHINLEDFGSGLKIIRFVPVAVLPSNKIHEEEMTYHGRKKKLIIQTRLDYDLVKATPVEAFPALIAQTFYQFIDRYQQHRVKDFDIAGFKKRVGEVFRQEGWLSEADLS